MTEGELFLFGDGRLIWTRKADHPQGANPLTTGYLEQRLTPEGVELMRSEVLTSGLLEPGERECEAGEYIGGRLYGEPGGSFRTPNTELAARLTDPASWLPDSAWEDREIRAYVPSEYTIRLSAERALNLPGFAAELPAAAAELIRCKNWERQDAGRYWYYVDFTTDEARVLATALDDAGFNQDEQANAYHLEYDFNSQDTLVRIEFYPQLPHQHATMGSNPDRPSDLPC
jgi:hypothetical protein